MAEKLGEGRRTEDRRGTGRARRVRHTAHGGDMVGDKRKLPRKIDAPSAEGSRSVPIAETVGGDLKRKENGGGSRAVPKAMKVGEW